MPRDRGTFTPRRFVTTGALGPVGAIAPSARVDAAEPTAEERANVQVVQDLCAAWTKKDIGRIESLLADTLAVRWSERVPIITGRTTAFERIKGILQRPGVELALVE